LILVLIFGLFITLTVGVFPDLMIVFEGLPLYLTFVPAELMIRVVDVTEGINVLSTFPAEAITVDKSLVATKWIDVEPEMSEAAIPNPCAINFREVEPAAGRYPMIDASEEKVSESDDWRIPVPTILKLELFR